MRRATRKVPPDHPAALPTADPDVTVEIPAAAQVARAVLEAENVAAGPPGSVARMTDETARLRPADAHAYARSGDEALERAVREVRTMSARLYAQISAADVGVKRVARERRQFA